MKRTNFFLVVPFLLLLLTGCKPDAMDVYNHPVNISDFRGKWVIIHYWATWCPLCIAEIPALNTLARYYRDQVVILGVNPNHLDNNTLIQLRQSYQVYYRFLQNFPIEKWGGKVKQLPVIFILDKKGRLYQTLYGPQTLTNLKSILNLPDVVYD